MDIHPNDLCVCGLVRSCHRAYDKDGKEIFPFRDAQGLYIQDLEAWIRANEQDMHPAAELDPRQVVGNVVRWEGIFDHFRVLYSNLFREPCKRFTSKET